MFDAGNVRITLDRNLRFGRRIDLFMQEAEFPRICVAKPDNVLEVKYDEFLPGFIANVLESGNMRQNRYKISNGFFTAFRKRTMDKAPTMPNDTIKFDCIATIIAAITTGMPAAYVAGGSLVYCYDGFAFRGQFNP